MFLDFRPYTDAGFFISPNPYTGEFSPIGEISMTIQPALRPKAKLIKSAGAYIDGLYSQKNTSNVEQEEISASELLEMAVKEAKALGANGVSNFKCLLVTDVDPVERYHYEISGFAIRIDE